MSRKLLPLNFDQTLNALRENGFEVAQYAQVQDGMLVSKNGVGAVLVPGKANDNSASAAAALAITPGILVHGELARLLDRGYQKFIKTSKFELPATASQLQSIHSFTEELNRLTGAMGLYNESLGTTSDVYEYDRLKGREAPSAVPEGH